MGGELGEIATRPIGRYMCVVCMGSTKILAVGCNWTEPFAERRINTGKNHVKISERT